MAAGDDNSHGDSILLGDVDESLAQLDREWQQNTEQQVNFSKIQVIGFNKELEKTQILSGILTPAPNDSELILREHTNEQDVGSLERDVMLS